MPHELTVVLNVVTYVLLAVVALHTLHKILSDGSDDLLTKHVNDLDNARIEEKDKAYRAQVDAFIQVDEEGDYSFKEGALHVVNYRELALLDDRLAYLQVLVEARLGRIPCWIYFDKKAWQRVKTDRADWQDIAHYCRKIDRLIGSGLHRQFRVDS